MSEPATDAPSGDAHCASWYEIDREDRLRALSSDWDAFADGNAGPGARAGQVLGRPLRSFIAGDVPRMFIEAALQAVRLTGRPRTLGYRCDAPAVERLLTMTLVPLDDGGVRVEHQVVSARQRETVPAFRTVPPGEWTQTRPGARPRWRCSQCLRLSVSLSGPWSDAAPLDATSAPVVDVRYTLCPVCVTEIPQPMHASA